MYVRLHSSLLTSSWQVQVPESAGTEQNTPVLGKHGTGVSSWGSVYISGQVVREVATCTDSLGQSTVNLTVLGLPAGFSTASVTCKFLPWSTVEDLLQTTEQVTWIVLVNVSLY